MKPELPWMGVLSVIRIFFFKCSGLTSKCKCTNIISLLTAIITLNTFYEKVFMQDQVDMFCERCCSQSPSCNKLELCLKEMNFTDSQFRICSAKIVPLPHIGCRKHWLASLSFMTNPITSFNIPPAHDPTSLWGPLWGQVLLIVLSYEIHFLLNAEAAIWFFFLCVTVVVLSFLSEEECQTIRCTTVSPSVTCVPQQTCPRLQKEQNCNKNKSLCSAEKRLFSASSFYKHVGWESGTEGSVGVFFYVYIFLAYVFILSFFILTLQVPV